MSEIPDKNRDDLGSAAAVPSPVFIEIKSVPLRSSGRDMRLREGDVIVAVDDTPVRARGELVQAIAKKRVGERVRLRIRRSGDYRNVVITLAPLGSEHR